MIALLRALRWENTVSTVFRSRTQDFEAHPTINSELLYYVRHGRIQARPDIARFEGKTVYFVTGEAKNLI